MFIYYRRPILLIIIFLLAMVSSCRERYSSPTIETLEAIAELDNSNYKGRIVTEETKEKIKGILEQYEQDIETNVKKKAELASLYKQLGVLYLEIDSLEMDIQEVLSDRSYEIIPETEQEEILVNETLALRFMDEGMYREALGYFEKAIEVFPENELLFYYAGLCSAKVAKSIIRDDELRYKWLLTAEKYYKTAIDLYPYYSEAMYALSILYIYEFNLPEEAESYLLKLKDMEQKDTDVRFLLANVYYMTERYEQAILEYNEILRITDSEEVRNNAAANQNEIIRLLDNE